MLRILLAALAILLAVPGAASAMTDETSHYNSGGDEKAQMADPDEKNEFGAGSPTATGPSAREQALLGESSTPQTYGFGGHDGSLSYGFSQGPTGYLPYPRNR